MIDQRRWFGRIGNWNSTASWKLAAQEEGCQSCCHGRSDQPLVDEIVWQGSAIWHSLDHVRARLQVRHRLTYLWRATGKSTVPSDGSYGIEAGSNCENF
jgi:hypothetical protein